MLLPLKRRRKDSFAKEKGRSRATEKTGRRKDISSSTGKTGSRKYILATEGHGISRKKAEAETRERQAAEKIF
jgi:hypothetical protein